MNDLREQSTEQLLASWAPLHAELSVRFGNSNIVGCYGELLVATAMGGTVRANSAAGGDVELADGSLVEVKCRRGGTGAGRNASGIYKWDPSINDWPFQFAAFVQLDELTLQPVRAFVLDAASLAAPIAFGKKSPVLGQQLHANRSYEGEVDLLPQMLGATGVELPVRSHVIAERPSRTRLPQRAAEADLVASMKEAGQADWIWLANGAIERFKAWRVQGGASSASAASYASGARAFVSYWRQSDLESEQALEGFADYLVRTRGISSRAISDYVSHSRAFLHFLESVGPRRP